MGYFYYLTHYKSDRCYYYSLKLIFISNFMNTIFLQLFNDLHLATYKNSNKFKRFLFNTKQNAILVFYIASQKSYQATLEQICFNISPKVVSRSTIQNTLKDGVAIGFFVKKTNQKDKRAKFYKISDDALKTLEEWTEKQRSVFTDNLNKKFLA